MIPHARLHPSAPMIMVATSVRPALITLSVLVATMTMIRPNRISETRSTGSSMGLIPGFPSGVIAPRSAPRCNLPYRRKHGGLAPAMQFVAGDREMVRKAGRDGEADSDRRPVVHLQHLRPRPRDD